MKNIIKAIVLSVLVFACDAEKANQDVAGIIDESAKPTVSYVVNTQSGVEFEETVITVDITMSKALNNSTTFSVNQIGGNAVLHEDYEATTAVIAPYTTTGQVTITITKDVDQSEGNENLQVEVGALAVPDTYEVLGTEILDISIEDYTFCPWTLEMTDLYGDGWNGGFITVEFDGISTDYFCENLDGEVSLAETQTVIAPVNTGANFTISYTSGGGTGAGPGWESENVYTVTAPDGTVYSDGPIPAEGVIVTGTSTCN